MEDHGLWEWKGGLSIFVGLEEEVVGVVVLAVGGSIGLYEEVCEE